MIEIKKDKPCSCEGEKSNFVDCMVCGKPLVYWKEARRLRCSICGKEFDASCACEDGHFVCDACHEAGSAAFFLPYLLASKEKDPLRLFEEVVSLPRVHMHGPEHHAIVPCVLLTAYHNNGGELDLDKALSEALRRASQVPGGSCGYWGVCGAAAGAGIYMSVLLGSTPLHRDAWPYPIHTSGECLRAIAALGGPRCCKRTCRTSITKAAELTREWLGVNMPCGEITCRHVAKNRECLGVACPYFPRRQAEKSSSF